MPMIPEGFSTDTWFAGICKDCGNNVVVTQPDAENHPHDDYWWYCSNKKCDHHHPGEHTGDMEKPVWVKFIKKNK